MTPDRVDEMLKSYRYEVGRCKHLQTEIDLLKRNIARDRASVVHDLVGPGAQVITDMPRGTQTGDPTSKYGMMLADGYVPESISEMEAEMAALEAEYEERHKTVVYVEGWLCGISDQQRWIVEKKIIDEVIWREILQIYQEQYGEYRSKDTLKRILAKAMDAIYDMAE